MTNLSNGIIKSKIKINDQAFPLALVKKENEKTILNTMATAVMSVLGLNFQQNVSDDSFEEPIDLLEKNSLQICSIDKNKVIDELEINNSIFTSMQTLAVPFNDNFVQQLLTCPKIQVKQEITSQYDPNKKSLVEEERTLLIGKIGDTYIPFQFNIRKGQPTKKDVNFSTNLSVILNGKEYCILERFDSKKGHSNLFVDGFFKEANKKENLQIKTTSHLHVFSQTVMLSLFNILSNQGYDAQALLTDDVMSRLDAKFHTSFISQESARDFFRLKYNIINSPNSEHKTIENAFKSKEKLMEFLQSNRETSLNNLNQKPENNQKTTKADKKKYNKKKKAVPTNTLSKQEREALVQSKKEKRKLKKEAKEKQSRYKGKSKTGIDFELDF